MSRLPTQLDDPVKFDPRVHDLLGVVGHQDDFARPVPAKAASEGHAVPDVEAAQPAPETGLCRPGHPGQGRVIHL